MQVESVSKAKQVAQVSQADQSAASCLAPELLVKIFSNLSSKDLAACRSVSKHWRTVAIDQTRRRLQSGLTDALQVCGHILDQKDAEQLQAAEDMIKMAETVHSIILAHTTSLTSPLAEDEKTSHHRTIIEALAAKEGRSAFIFQLAHMCPARDVLEKTFFEQTVNEKKFKEAARIALHSSNALMKQLIQNLRERFRLLQIPENQFSTQLPDYLASIRADKEEFQRALVSSNNLEMLVSKSNNLEYMLYMTRAGAEDCFRVSVACKLVEANRCDEAYAHYCSISSSFYKHEAEDWLVTGFIQANRFDNAWKVFMKRCTDGFDRWCDTLLTRIIKSHTQNIHLVLPTIPDANVKQKVAEKLAWYEASKGNMSTAYQLCIRHCLNNDVPLFLQKGMIYAWIGCARVSGLFE